MMNIALVVRLLVRRQDEVFRIVSINSFAKKVWLCRIDDDSWPFPMPLNDLIDELDPDTGSFKIELDDPFARVAIQGNAKSATDRRGENNYALIKPLVSGENAYLILSHRRRAELIAQRLTEVRSTRQTLSSLLKRFLKRGMTSEAVRPDYANCGGRGKQRNPKKGKVGRPRTISPGVGINVNDETRRMMQVAADYYLQNLKKKPHPTLQDAIDRIVRLYFSKPIQNSSGRVISVEVEPDQPTVRQLQHFIGKTYPYRHIRRRREGGKNWDLHEREILGLADSHVQGPGDTFQIDATVADIYLVSQMDRRRIVGRPVIYFAIDVFSRLITGIYVGYEGPSWIGAMMVLVNMVTPKIEFCRQYEIEIDESEWPSHYAPRAISGDRGELMSVDLGKNIIENLRIDIENASPGRPDLRSLVERRFGIVPAKFKKFVPGWVEQDFGERGAHDYRLDATLNLYEFTQLVIYGVLEHNFTPIRDKSLPPEMVTEGYSPAPIDLWQWGIVNRSGQLKAFTIDEVALNVMPSETGQVTEKGIKCHGRFYTCPSALREDWFAQARHYGSWQVSLPFDPRNLGILYIRDRSLPNGYERCSVLDPSISSDGISLFEAEEVDFAKKCITAATEPPREAKRIAYDANEEEIVRKAKNATRAVVDAGIPKSQRIKDIPSNRADEKEVQRGPETFDLTDSPPAIHLDSSETSSPPAPSTSESQLKDQVALLLRKRKEREGR